MYKINYMGRRINGRFDSIKAAVKRITRWSLIKAAQGGALSLAFLAGGLFYSTSTTSYAHIIHEEQAPILDRIAFCESGNHQFNKNGQVLLNINTNHTVDIGLYQINSIHEAEAHQLGFDLFTEDGNTAYAKWMYANRGTGDWYSSAKCWMK